MPFLGVRATAIFRRIIDGLATVGDHRTFDNANGAFMAIHVEIIGRHGDGMIVSLAHYFTQNGDMMRDPDVEFYVTATEIVPMTFQQDGIGVYTRAAWFEGDIMHTNPRHQRDIAEFCEMWLPNIAEQQGI
jgi:hypothetical protein